MHVVVTAGAMGDAGAGAAAAGGAFEAVASTEVPAAGSAAALVAELTRRAADADLLIAADGGADLLGAAGRLPDVLVGDLDSISSATLAACVAGGVEVHELPVAKDESDTEYALRVAVERGATRITVVGALGGPRLDHLLSNVFLLTAPWLAACDLRLVDARFEVYLARGDVHLDGLAGDVISLLPLTSVVAGVETEGLAYPLRRESLLMGATRGVSNVLQSTEGRVRHGEGSLLVVHDHGTRAVAEGGW